MASAKKTADEGKGFISLERLHVTFGRQAVIRDVTLNIPRGQTVAIIGESGCGKTVLLKHMIGLLHPTSGHVVFDGQRIDHLSDKELTRQRNRFGFVFQNAALFDSMTIAENVAFPLREHRQLPPDEVEQRVAQNLAEVGLPTAEIPLALFSFNAGIELGQLAFVGVVLLVAAALCRVPLAWPRWAQAVPAYGIGTMAAFWFLQRAVSLM